MTESAPPPETVSEFFAKTLELRMDEAEKIRSSCARGT
jgi:hypothetical protein